MKWTCASFDMQFLWILDDNAGEYFVLGVDLDRYDTDNPGKYLRGLLKDDLDGKAVHAFENYVGVVSSPPGPDFDNLTQMVNDYMERPPFNFPNPLNFFGGVKRVKTSHLSFRFTTGRFTLRPGTSCPIFSVNNNSSVSSTSSFFFLVLKDKSRGGLFIRRCTAVRSRPERNPTGKRWSLRRPGYYGEDSRTGLHERHGVSIHQFNGIHRRPHIRLRRTRYAASCLPRNLPSGMK